MIHRPEYTGDAPYTIGSGDLVVCDRGNGHRSYYVVKEDARHVGEGCWKVDHVNLNYETRAFDVTVVGDHVWKGCVSLVSRSRVREFLATGHDPFFRTAHEVLRELKNRPVRTKADRDFLEQYERKVVESNLAHDRRQAIANKF